MGMMASRVTMHAPRSGCVESDRQGGAARCSARRNPSLAASSARTVRFADGIASLQRDGYRVFLEVGPHPTLGGAAHAVGRRDDSGLAEAWPGGLAGVDAELARLYVRGVSIDWAVSTDRTRGSALRFRPIPSTHALLVEAGAPATRLTTAPPRHRLIGHRLPTAEPIFESTLTPSSLPYLADHRIHGAVLVAGPVFAEMAQAAALSLNGPRRRRHSRRAPAARTPRKKDVGCKSISVRMGDSTCTVVR